MQPRFYFATCQIGTEKAVKAEVLLEYPQLRFSFSRPGFITFKEMDDTHAPLLLRKGIFTRLWGEVVGQTKDQATLPELLSLIPPKAIVQCYDRDLYTPGDEPTGFVRHGNIREIVKGLSTLQPEGVPVLDGDVYSLVWVDHFHVFLTRHIHSKGRVVSPGNIPLIALPDNAPSRAYLKIEEAILRFKPATKKGLKVLEMSCASGGATLAMLDRGLDVTGIDTQYLKKRVRTMPGFTPIHKTANAVVREDLSSCNPEWLVMDINIAPLEALDELTRMVSLLKAVHGKKLCLSRGFFTIKLNDWKFASYIPLYMRRLQQTGFRSLRATQLWSNRQEFFVYAPCFA
jgi:23S rRNA (cytidine2498-2'-O)-methyltransferase